MLGSRWLIACSLVMMLAGALKASEVKETVRITVTGEGLPQALLLDRPDLLALSNVFSGRFIGPPSIAPDGRRIEYRLAFDIQTLDGVKRDAYVLLYVQGTGQADGYIYLPGRADPDYPGNASTILRNGIDGTWRSASPAWAAALNQVLPRE